MGGLLKVGRPFGVKVNIHWSFWLVVLWAGGEGIRWSGRWQGAFFAVGAILLFFLCVLLHELGHALTAKLLGLEVKGITLLPFGGLAQIHNISQNSWQEFVVVLAGPMVNLLLALVLGVGFLFVWGADLMIDFTHSAGTVAAGVARSVFSGGNLVALTAFLILTNLLLVAFNLLPAFPMDGGRLLRASLAMQMPYQRATRIAVRIGQGLAIVIIGLTLTPVFSLQSPSAVFIAVFVFVGATYEDKVTQARWRLHKLQVGDVMSTPNVTFISPEERLGMVMERVFKAPQFDLPVLVQGTLTGMLRRDDLLIALRHGQADLPVSRVMRTDYPSVRPGDTLQTAQDQMLRSKFATLPVLHRGNLVGLISIRDVNGPLSTGALANGSVAKSA